MRHLTPAEVIAGICPGCDAQPCECATRKNPNWIAELLADVAPIPADYAPRSQPAARRPAPRALWLSLLAAA